MLSHMSVREALALRVMAKAVVIVAVLAHDGDFEEFAWNLLCGACLDAVAVTCLTKFVAPLLDTWRLWALIVLASNPVAMMIDWLTALVLIKGLHTRRGFVEHMHRYYAEAFATLPPRTRERRFAKRELAYFRNELAEMSGTTVADG